MEESRKLDITSQVFGWAWVVTWFGAIWIPEYRIRLFFTGGFCLVLGLGAYNQYEKVKKTEA